MAGVSCGCADVFGATDEAEESGFDLIKDNTIPGTSGLAGRMGVIHASARGGDRGERFGTVFAGSAV